MNVALHPQMQHAGINVLSLCTGGGGLDLGLELALPGARTVCMVEREAFAAAHLVSAMETGLMAPAPVWSDARTFNGRAWRGSVDIVIGGIPCQPHSLAGKRLAEEDERDLWSTARRILVQSGAWAVLIENVGGMLSSGGAERIWRDLGQLGFAREIGLFTAAEIGASHDRERLFILGVADTCSTRSQRFQFDRSPQERNGATASGSIAQLCGASLVHAKRPKWRSNATRKYECNGNNAERYQATGWTGEPSAALEDTTIARSRAISVQQRRQDKTSGDINRTGIFPPGPGDQNEWKDVLARAPELEPAFRRVADGLASPMDIARVDRLRLLGNGVVPLQAAYAVRTLASRLAKRGSARAAVLTRMMELAA